MRRARRVLAFALLLVLSSLLFLTMPAAPAFVEDAPIVPVPVEARFGEIARVSEGVIIPTLAAYTPKDAPSRHPAKLVFIYLLFLLCLLLFALRSVCAHVPPQVRVRSLRGLIGHPHHAPPFFA